MKEDFRSLLRESRTPPYYTLGGVPFYVSKGQLTAGWLEGRFKIIFCQSCWKAFLVVKEFEGDPPFHDRSDAKVCIGNTMLHLDPLNDFEDLELIQESYANRRVRELHASFWSRKEADAWWKENGATTWTLP